MRFFIFLLSLLLVMLNCTKKDISLKPEEVSLSEMEICYNKLNSSDRWAIYVNTSDGFNETLLINNKYDDVYTPIWSPDSIFIICRYDSINASSYLRKFNVEKRSFLDIENNFEVGESSYPFFWLQNSNRIIFQSQRIGQIPCVNAMNPDGSERVYLFDDWTKIYPYLDGAKLLYITENSDVLSIDVITGTEKKVLCNLDESDSIEKRILDFDGEEKLLMSSDSENANLLFFYNLTTKEKCILYTAEDNYHIINGRYSNDHTKIIFMERNYLIDESHLKLILHDSVVNTLFTLSSGDKWFDYHPIQFSGNNDKVLFGVNKNISGSNVSWITYLYCYDLNSSSYNLISKGAIDGCWKK